jgi:chorismate mutase / prephenate dehydratase
VPRTPVNSNAEAARLAAERPGARGHCRRDGGGALRAAIAGHAASRITRTTRPVSWSSAASTGGPSGRDKTSILVSTRNEPGALYKVLEPFHRHGISLTRIETRPAKSGSWSYVFFIDFDGHQRDRASRRAR